MNAPDAVFVCDDVAVSGKVPRGASGRIVLDPHAVNHSGGNRRIAQRHGLVESRMRGNAHVRFRECGPEKRRSEEAHRAPARSSADPLGGQSRNPERFKRARDSRGKLQ